MNLGRTFTTPESDEATRDLIARYLDQAGFTCSALEPDLVYDRGSSIGSATSLSTKRWQTRALVQVRPGPHQTTEVVARFDINTTGQIVTRGERNRFEKELDGLVAAAGGRNAQAVSIATAPDRLKLQKQYQSGANWFFWIAALSVINSLSYALDLNLGFLIGLGATQVVQAVAVSLQDYVNSQTGTVIQLIAWGLQIAIAGLFALFGLLGRRGHRWPLLVGMILYALDALIFLLVTDWLSIGFHLFALLWIFIGWQAAGKLAHLDRAAPAAPAPLAV